MRPFNIPAAIEGVRDLAPEKELLLSVIQRADIDTRLHLAGLWLTEGIPYCFMQRPGLYESFRRWLARRLNVQAKEITLIGSGRQGFCLSPGNNIGRPFSEHSDLDFTVVSPSLFAQLVSAFSRWKADYSAGVVSPRSEREKFYWNANLASVPNGIKRGLLDPYKIPTWSRYPEAQKVAQTAYEAMYKLRITPDAPKTRRVSIRIYRDWDSFIQQLAVNLSALAVVLRRTGTAR
jgi:hypothetical protein